MNVSSERFESMGLRAKVQFKIFFDPSEDEYHQNYSFKAHLGAWNYNIFFDHGENQYHQNQSLKAYLGAWNSKFSLTMAKINIIKISHSRRI